MMIDAKIRIAALVLGVSLVLAAVLVLPGSSAKGTHIIEQATSDFAAGNIDIDEWRTIAKASDEVISSNSGKNFYVIGGITHG